MAADVVSAFRVRPRAEADAQPRGGIDAERAAALALEVAATAGAAHAVAASATADRFELLAGVVDALSTTNQSNADAQAASIEANVRLAAQLAEAQSTSARLTAEKRQQPPQQHGGASSTPVGGGLTGVAAELVLRRRTDDEAAAARASGAAALAAAARTAASMSSCAQHSSEILRAELAKYRQRAIDAEARAAAIEEATYGHRHEVVVLLKTIERFASLSGNAESIDAQNRRLQGQLRAYEKVLTPSQIVAAALPENYRPPASFRALSDDAPSSMLRKAAPALFALRAMDHKELTLGEVVQEWVAQAEALGSAREALAARDADVVRLERALAAAERLALEERMRRTTAENGLHKLAARRVDPDARFELDSYRVKLSLALDEKVALQLRADELESAVKDRDAEVSGLAERVAHLTSQLDARALSAEVAAQRLHYQREEERLIGECARLRSGWATALQHAEALDERVRIVERAGHQAAAAAKAAASAAATSRSQLEAVSKELSTANARNANLEKDLAAALRDLTSLQAAAAQESATKTAATAAGTVVAARPAAQRSLKLLSDIAAQLAQCNANVGSVAAKLVSKARDDIAASRAEADAATTAEAVRAVAVGVQRALTDTSLVRAELLQQTAQRDARITDLQAALDASQVEAVQLHQRLAAAEALVERMAVPVTETVLGRGVPEAEEVSCGRCESRRAACEASNERAVESAEQAAAARAHAAAMEQEAAAAREAVALLNVRCAAKDATIERLRQRISQAAAEHTHLHKLRNDLRRAVSTLTEGTPLADASSRTEEDRDGAAAPDSVSSAGDGDASLTNTAVQRLVEAARIMQQARADAEGAVGAFNEAINRERREHGEDDDDAAAEEAGGGGEEDDADAVRDAPPAAAAAGRSAGKDGLVVDRRALVGTVKQLWSVAMACKALEGSNVQAGDDDGDDADGAVFSSGGWEADAGRDRVTTTAAADRSPAADASAAATAAATAALQEELAAVKDQLLEITQVLTQSRTERDDALSRLAKSETTCVNQQRLLTLYTQKIASLEKPKNS